MKPLVAVIDTNIVVSGLISSTPQSPTSTILDGMLKGMFPFLLSMDLVSEYRRVLLRRRIQARHGLNEDEIDVVLTRIAANGIMRQPEATHEPSRDRGDDHLWALCGVHPGTVLVTGDRELFENPPESTSVLSPRDFLTYLHNE